MEKLIADRANLSLHLWLANNLFMFSVLPTPLQNPLYNGGIGVMPSPVTLFFSHGTGSRYGTMRRYRSSQMGAPR